MDYLVGIDLGTSNTVLAFARCGSQEIRILPVDQLVAAGEVDARAQLPSVRYHPAPGELPADDLRLPWQAGDPGGLADVVVGDFARELGTQVPGRQVASAKSWLSHPGVDRTAPILPWGAEPGVPKVSPLHASASYLAHLRAGWNVRFPDAPLERQWIVLTVPASFDEGARALTVEAARLAGLPQVHLLEEPQAAFHDWLFLHRAQLAAALTDAGLILVCDVGGGTTDFTLIRVEPGADGPLLTRIGVGDHLMLGGDNMDLTLAHAVERRMGEGTRLSAGRFSQLVQRCRVAKEQLLAADAPERVAVTLVGAGARLVGGARTVELEREEVERLIVDGFFPRVAADASPQRRRSAIVEFGLPHPADPAITRHLAEFLRRQAEERGEVEGDTGAGALPDTILLNGGVFHAHALIERLVDTIGGWRGGPPRVLNNAEPDLAVARGAVAHALARSGVGAGVGGGSARSYFLVLEDEAGGRRGICVLPRGTEEGREVPLPARSFALRLGQAVSFHLASTASSHAYRAGELINLDDPGFIRLPPLVAALPAPAGGRGREVAVRLTAALDEVGTLGVHCVSCADEGQRWRLSFALRGEPATAASDETGGLPPRFDDAIAAIESVFGSQSKEVDAKAVRQLRARLERLLGKRERWDLNLLRALFDALWERVRRRRRSAEHERVWLNLAGYCLRPGQGAPLDEWRVEQLWSLFAQGIQYVNESRNWAEWWTLWRRAAGGLDAAAQLQLLETLAEHLEAMEAGRSGPLYASYDDMVRLTASLEQVPVMHRIEVGRWLLERLRRPAEKPHTWWALGRVGARELLYGSAHNVVPPAIAAEWLEAVCALDWKAVEPAAFAAAQLARRSGDRARDLPSALREEVATRLEAAKVPPSWVTMVREGGMLDEEDRRRSFGESLPPGLKLLREA